MGACSVLRRGANLTLSMDGESTVQRKSRLEPWQPRRLDGHHRLALFRRTCASAHRSREPGAFCLLEGARILPPCSTACVARRLPKPMAEAACPGDIEVTLPLLRSTTAAQQPHRPATLS